MKERGAKSKKRIEPFIKDYNIDMSKYEEKEYISFDDFFTRKMKKEKINIAIEKDVLISPCDGKLQVYAINEETQVEIKGVKYTINELVRDEEISKNYKDGICLVYRLSVDDYHRYCYVDKGKTLSCKKINGKLHTVRPIANRYKVFRENQREYEILEYDKLGKTVHMEVGALQIGKINNYSLEEFNKGEEKGYFSYGASTIVLLIEKDRVEIDEDIIRISKEDNEVKVYYGEKVGKIKREEVEE
jgi:phosphatidylserine decarboxylase